MEQNYSREIDYSILEKTHFKELGKNKYAKTMKHLNRIMPKEGISDWSYFNNFIIKIEQEKNKQLPGSTHLDELEILVRSMEDQDSNRTP